VTILDRYIWRAMAAGTLLVMSVLLALSGFVNFVQQVDHIGTAHYQLPQAMTYVLASLPRSAHEMLSIAVLLGTLHGLGALAAKSELLVMRASGLSVRRLAVAVFIAALGMMIVGLALGELIAPSAQRYASRMRMFSLNEELSEAGGQNAWVKDGNQIINIQSQGDREALGEVYIFTLDADHKLASVTRALSGGFGTGGTWSLYDLRESDFTGFMQPKVEDNLRRAALKKLFSGDPHFNIPDPFEPYSRDWNIADPIPPEMLATLNQAKVLLFDKQHEPEKAQAEAQKLKDDNGKK